MTKSFLPTTTASERTLSDGRVLIPGEAMELTREQQNDPHNKRLIQEGQIVEDKSGGGKK